MLYDLKTTTNMPVTLFFAPFFVTHHQYFCPSTNGGLTGREVSA